MINKERVTVFSPSNSIKELVNLFSNRILPIISDASIYTIIGISGLGSNGVVFLVTDREGNTFALKIVNMLYYFIQRFDLDPVKFHESAYSMFDEISKRVENAKYLATFEEGVVPTAFNNAAEENSFYREIIALKAMRPDSDNGEVEYIYLVESGILKLVTIENKASQVYNFPYVVMPYVDGVELTRLVEREMGHCERLLFSLDCISSILDIVDFMHSRGVVHRDLYPNNFLYKKDGKLVLVDFGSAITNGNETFETSGERRGARRYMPPEQFINPTVADFISDYFFVGATLFNMLTLTTPFDRDRESNTFPRRLRDYWTKPSFLSDQTYSRIIDFVDKLTSFNRENRFHSMQSIKVEYLLIRELIDKDFSAQQDTL